MPALELVAAPAAPAGLVTSAISAPRGLAFPSGDLVDAAASLLADCAYRRGTAVQRGVVERRRTGGVYRDWREGPVWTVEVAPGLVRVRSTDRSRLERTAERGRETARRRAYLDRVLDELSEPGEDDTGDAAGGAGEGRGLVAGWSRKSRSRLVSSILELDLSVLVSGDSPPAMVTLTLPGDWFAVAPDAETAAQLFHRWTRAYAKKWGPLRCIWKREFQRRGAPHWHLWMVPPVPHDRLDEFRAWLSASWTQALGIADPEERARSLAAGTGLDFAEGARARDPKRLAVYFLKESLAGAKAYQNKPPAEWGQGASVGRYWGVRGIAKRVAPVEVEPAVATDAARVLRRWQRAQGRPALREAPTRGGGVVAVPTVIRARRRGSGGAGWWSVNDGPAFASQLARALGPAAPPRPRSQWGIPEGSPGTVAAPGGDGVQRPPSGG